MTALTLTVLVLSTGMLIIGILLGIQGLRIRLEVRLREERLKWKIEQVNRAVEQLTNGREDDAVAALQTLSVLGGRRSFEHLSLAKRKWSGNRRVLEYFEKADERLGAKVASGPAQKSGDLRPATE